MNSITFLVDINDVVSDCSYFEAYKSKKRIGIRLPKEALSDIFFKFVKAYPNSEIVEEEGEYNRVTFYDVDVDYIDKLISISEKYKSAYKEQAPKVVRNNKFKKSAVRVSAGILLAISLFAIAKESAKQIGFDFNIKFNIPSIGEIFDRKEVIKEDDLLKHFTNIEKNDIEEPVIEEEPEVKVAPIINIIEEKEEEKEVVEEKQNVDDYVKLNADNMLNGEKYTISNAYYSQSLSEIATRYGIDPSLALAVATHERGIHSNQVDSGGGIGLFQIQVEGGWNWNNRTITAYNFETNQYEDVLITTEYVADVFQNMQVGCMMLQNLLTTYNYNVLEAVTAYNYGTENVRHVLEYTASQTGASLEELNNMDNTKWLKYRDTIKGGDPEYLENVFKYIQNGTTLTFTKPNGEVINIEFDNLNYSNDMSL